MNLRKYKDSKDTLMRFLNTLNPGIEVFAKSGELLHKAIKIVSLTIKAVRISVRIILKEQLIRLFKK